MWESSEWGNLASIIKLITIGGNSQPTELSPLVCLIRMCPPSVKTKIDGREQGRLS